MKHSCTLKVRSYELDPNNHVNHAVYLQYLEYARLEFLNDSGFDYPGLLSRGYSIFVRELTITYLLPAVLNDILVITTYPIEKKHTSGILKQTIVRNEEPVCTAAVTWVCVNQKGRPSRIPDNFNLEALQPDLNDGGSL